MPGFDQQAARPYDRLTAGLDKLSRPIGRYASALIAIFAKSLIADRLSAALRRANSVARQERMIA